MTLIPVACPGHNGAFVKGLSFHISYAHLMKTLDDFAFKFYAPCLSFTLLHFQNSHVTLHEQTHICRSTSTPDLIDNSSAIAIYDFENPIYQAEDEGEEDCEIPGELARLLIQEEKAIQQHKEPVEVINLGTEANKKEVKIGANLEDNVKRRLAQMLNDYVEVFSWSYEDMPGLDTDIVVHRLPTKEDCPPVKQKV